MEALSSKTVLGLLLILGVFLLLVYTNRLMTAEVEVLKWVAASFFSVRTVANLAENFGRKE